MCVCAGGMRERGRGLEGGDGGRVRVKWTQEGREGREGGEKGREGTIKRGESDESGRKEERPEGGREGGR